MPSLSASKDHFCPSKCVRLSSRAAIFTFSTSYRDVTDTQAKCRMRMARSQHAFALALPPPFRISNPSWPLLSANRGHLPGDHSLRYRKGRLFGFVVVRIPTWVRVTWTETMVLPARRPAATSPSRQLFFAFSPSLAPAKELVDLRQSRGLPCEIFPSL